MRNTFIQDVNSELFHYSYVSKSQSAIRGKGNLARRWLAKICNHLVEDKNMYN